MQISLELLTYDSSGISRMIDHKNRPFRPKGDQQFSHSLSEKQILVLDKLRLADNSR
jgi:hypothetical protein